VNMHMHMHNGLVEIQPATSYPRHRFWQVLFQARQPSCHRSHGPGSRQREQPTPHLEITRLLVLSGDRLFSDMSSFSCMANILPTHSALDACTVLGLSMRRQKPPQKQAAWHCMREQHSLPRPKDRWHSGAFPISQLSSQEGYHSPTLQDAQNRGTTCVFTVHRCCSLSGAVRRWKRVKCLRLRYHI
jgi:hypothetical protein